MNQPTPGHPDCIGSMSQQIPWSPLGPPPTHSPPPLLLLVSDSSSELEQPLNATDIVNANMSVVSNVLNSDLYIIVTSDTYIHLKMLLQQD